MINNALDSIKYIYDCAKYIFYAIIEFFPSPFREIIGVFLTVILVIIILKIVKLAGELIENLIGVFT